MIFSRFWKISILITVSLAAAIFTSLHGKLDKINLAYSSPRFWLAVFFSFTLCVLLILYIYWISKWLNRRIYWKVKPLKRSIYQFLYGVLIPSLADLVVMEIYFRVLGTDVFESGFMMSEYHGVCLFIFVVNLIFLVLYLWEKSNEIDGNPVPLTIHNSKIHVDLNSNDILYFYRVNRKLSVVTSEGEEYFTKYSLTYLSELFSEAGFFQINRSVIINPEIIKGYVRKDGKFQIIINPEHKSAIMHPQNDLFVVTTEHVTELKERFGQIIET